VDGRSVTEARGELDLSNVDVLNGTHGMETPPSDSLNLDSSQLRAHAGLPRDVAKWPSDSAVSADAPVEAAPRNAEWLGGGRSMGRNGPPKVHWAFETSSESPPPQHDLGTITLLRTALLGSAVICLGCGRPSGGCLLSVGSS
jgi:hypothetical protein